MPDEGHEETDRLLAALEKKLRRTYKEAKNNAEGKFLRYMRDFIQKDARHRQDVADGTWSAEEYENWRKNQLMYGETLEEIRDVIATDLRNTDKIAMDVARGAQPEIYATNFNYGTYTIEKAGRIDTSFTLYDHSTVERLMRDDPKLLPKPSKKRQKEIDASGLKWNQRRLTSAFTASILAGDSIPKMAKRISSVADMNENAAIRNARTMSTGAENAGREDSYERAEKMGIDLEQEWSATLDGATRHSHRMVDGEKVKVGQKFSNGVRFPGDPDGPAREIYNCRCTLIPVVDGIDPGAFDKTDTLRRKLENADITYEEWKRRHERSDDSDDNGIIGNIIKNVGSQERNQRWKHLTEEPADMSSYSKIDGDHTVEDDVKATNPGFNEAKEEGRREILTNCQRCVVAFECRQRGYDVTASKRLLADPLPNSKNEAGWPNAFKNGSKGLMRCPGKDTESMKDNVESLMRAFGNGARAAVSVKWKKRRAGHVFIAVNENGKIKYYDPQSGKIGYNGLDRAKPDKTMVLRIDNRELTGLVSKCIQDGSHKND